MIILIRIESILKAKRPIFLLIKNTIFPHILILLYIHTRTHAECWFWIQIGFNKIMYVYDRNKRHDKAEKTSAQNKKTGFWDLKVWSTSAFASFYLDFWNSKIFFNLEGEGFNPKTSLRIRQWSDDNIDYLLSLSLLINKSRLGKIKRYGSVSR